MVKFDLKYLSKDRDRHGNIRYYVRRKGLKKVRIKAIVGSEEFIEEYSKALSSNKQITNAHKINNKSIEFLCHKYHDSEEFLELAVNTQSWRRRELRNICIKYGNNLYAEMESRHVRILLDEKSGKPGAKRNRLKALKALFAWAVDRNLIQSNPTSGIRVKMKATDGYHTWSDEEIAQFETFHPLGTKPHLAMMLLLYTACRRSDAVMLGKANVKGSRIYFRPTKTAKHSGVEVDLLVHPKLSRAISSTDSGHSTFLVTDFGKPFSVNGFGNAFREWCNRAGLDKCIAHGLRKAAARRLAEADATGPEIVAVLGHRSIQQADPYLRKASRRLLADAAFNKMT